MKVTVIIDGKEVESVDSHTVTQPALSAEQRDLATDLFKALEEYLDSDKTTKAIQEAKLTALMWKLRRLLEGSQSSSMDDVPEVNVVDVSGTIYEPPRKGGLAPDRIHD